MADTTHFPGLYDGHIGTPYFPPTYEKPDCRSCEKQRDCHNCGKYQRDRRDFSVISGRCPRLPDRRGMVDQAERELYANVFPLIHAEKGYDEVHLSLSIPGEKRLRNVYRNYGYWWFRDGKTADGYQIRRCLSISNSFSAKQEIYEYMEDRNWDYCIFRAEISENYL